MKIISLRVDNFQRVKAVEIRPDGNVVRLTGKNEQGKSSVLDAIWAAIGGARHIPEVPVRLGETEAFIEVDLGELHITRIIKNREGDEPLPMLIVKNKEGNKFSDPQKVLNKLIGLLTFDPLQFARAKDEDRFEILRKFVPDFDFVAADKADKEARAKRTDVNRDAKRLWAQVEGIQVKDDELEAVDESALVERLTKASEINTAIERERLARNNYLATMRNYVAQANSARETAERLRKQAEEAEREAEQLDKIAGEIEADLRSRPPLEVPVDVAELQREIEDARSHNEVVNANLRSRRQRAELKRQAEEKDAESEKLTEEIEAIAEAKNKAIAASAMPVPGISFSEGDKVLLDGLPFAQASTAKKIRASVAVASALNPELRVIQVRDGSLLDEDAKRIIAEFAEANDMQVWIEEVDGSGDVGFYIEDGMIRGAVAEAAE